MSELTISDNKTFNIGDISSLSRYVERGVAQQVKTPKTMTFVSE